MSDVVEVRHEWSEGYRRLHDTQNRRRHYIAETAARPRVLVAMCEPNVRLSPGFLADNARRKKLCKACQRVSEPQQAP